MLHTLLRNIFSRNSGQGKKLADQLFHAGMEIESTINDDEPHTMHIRMEEALNKYRQALASDPGHAAAAASAATLLDKLGNIRSARTTLEPFLEQDTATPEVAEAYGQICHQLGDIDGGIDIIQRTLNNGELPEEYRYRLHFILGNLYDKNREYDKAFSNFQVGNKKFPVAEPIITNLVSSLIEVFSEDKNGQYPRSTISSELPVFIIGMGKSGTTLVEQVLASHSQVYGAGELKLILRLGIKGELARAIHSDTPYPYCIADLTQKQVNAISNHYLRQLRGYSASASRITDKLPTNFLDLGLISLLFPEARIINCTRGAMDTCFSLYTAPFTIPQLFGKDFDSIAEYYLQYRKLMAHWQQVLDIRIMTVTYEALVSDPEHHIRSIIEFCGLAWEEQCLNFFDSDRLVTTSSYDKVRQPVYTTAIGRWKNYETHLKPLQERLSMEHE